MGWVRNAADGSVEAEFAGDRALLESMIAWCEQGPALARVTRVDADWLEDGADYSSFTVRA
jgi:acylphosphatase